MLTQDEIKEINKSVDIGALLTFLGAPVKNIHDLNRRGVDFRVNAWYRGGDNPNGLGITYYFDKEKWFVTDFTHREFGNIDLLDFMTKILKIPFRKAIEHLTFASGKKNGFEGRSIKTSGVQPLHKLERPVPIDPSVMNLFEQGLHPYWHNRGFTPEIAKTFELGFCPAQIGNLKHRLTIPIYDDLNRLVAIQGRTLDDEETPKYTYLDGIQGESAKLTLYNFARGRHYAKQRGWAGIVEGCPAVWRAEQYEYKNFMGTMSTSVTDRQLEMMISLGVNIIIFFDFDDPTTMAGQIGAMKLAQRLLQRGVKVWICNIGFVSDPADLTLQQFTMTLKNARQFTGGQ
jgi:DNA primase